MTRQQTTPIGEVPASVLLAGFGATNQAVAKSLILRGHNVVVFDDEPEPSSASCAAAELGLPLETIADERHLQALIRDAELMIPTPGLPWNHPALITAEALGVATASEFDLARVWDTRPIAAVTGTNGKTTTTQMVSDALQASGIRTATAGNNDTPLVTAIDDREAEVLVVEASSFRLAHTQCLRADAACWVNFAADHLDKHRNLASYEAAKARIWHCLSPDGIAIANRDDAVVMSHVRDDRRIWTFAVKGAAVWCVEADTDMLSGPFGVIASMHELRRAMPHDIANALAAAATATAVGATVEGLQQALVKFEPSTRCLRKIASIQDVDYYDDSAATTPHATLAAVGGLESVVLIAGGRNKGTDLRALLAGVEHIAAVVAVGEAADEISAVFQRIRPVFKATGMDEAVRLAAELAQPGTAVLLSPACASFDTYSSYTQRGAHFASVVAQAAHRHGTGAAVDSTADPTCAGVVARAAHRHSTGGSDS